MLAKNIERDGPMPPSGFSHRTTKHAKLSLRKEPNYDTIKYRELRGQSSALGMTWYPFKE